MKATPFLKMARIWTAASPKKIKEWQKMLNIVSHRGNAT